jgi:hypothetical protein
MQRRGGRQLCEAGREGEEISRRKKYPMKTGIQLGPNNGYNLGVSLPNAGLFSFAASTGIQF